MGEIRRTGAFGLVVLLACAAALSGAGTTTAAPQLADVTVSGPTELFVSPGTATPLDIHVLARVQCARGFDAPVPLVVTPSRPADEAPAILFEPASVRLAWHPAPDAADAYVVDAVARFNITTPADPEVAHDASAVVVVHEAAGSPQGLECQPEGYDLRGEEHALALHVLPDDPDGATSAPPAGGPPVQWVPMLLASAILAALAIFAALRERHRRRGG